MALNTSLPQRTKPNLTIPFKRFWKPSEALRLIVLIDLHTPLYFCQMVYSVAPASLIHFTPTPCALL